MSEYVAPRSVVRLEEEIAELEKAQELVQEPQEEETPEEDFQEEPQQESPPLEEEEEPKSKEEETFKKRYSDLRRHSQKQAQEFKDKIKELEDKLGDMSRKQTLGNLPTKEEAEEWAKKNPKAAAIIRALATEQATTVAPSQEDVMSIKAELELTKQQSVIRKAHPDFDDIVADDDFHDWAEKQPPRIQDLVYEGSAEDVIWALDQYKASKKPKTDPNKKAAEAVGSKGDAKPETRKKKTFSESQVERMSMQEYEKNAEAIQEAISNGTFEYDLSGAAR